MPDAPHRIAFPVYYEDTDAGGIVYYANYLKFAERARTEWLKEKGFSQRALRETDGVLFVVTHCDVYFRQPAFLDDVLDVETQLRECGRATMTMHQRVCRAGELLVEMTVELACVNGTGRPTRMPEAVRAALEV